MQNLASYAAALAMALECIRDCGDSRWALKQGSPYHSMQQAGGAIKSGPEKPVSCARRDLQVAQQAAV